MELSNFAKDTQSMMILTIWRGDDYSDNRTDNFNNANSLFGYWRFW